MVAGLAIGLLVHAWRAGKHVGTATSRDSSAASQAMATGSSEQPAKSETGEGTPVPAPPAREFKLPAPAAATAANKEAPTALPKTAQPAPKPAPHTVTVPANWMLRGSGAQGYDLLSDHVQVFGGQFSALLKSHEQNVAVTRFGSIMQSVAVGALAGKRVEFSAYLRAEDVRERTVALWIRAVDPDNIVLLAESTSARVPKVTDAWTRYSIVVDVPWATAEVAYGVALHGKGAVWMDDANIDVVDRAALPLTAAGGVSPRNSVAVVVEKEGAMDKPSNLGFEETSVVEATVREGPGASVTATQF